MTFKTDKNFKDTRENNYFHIIARGVIIDSDYILVAHAKNTDNTFLPGGHLEFNENLKQTLKREIKEEMGMDCIVDKYIGEYGLIYGKRAKISPNPGNSQLRKCCISRGWAHFLRLCHKKPGYQGSGATPHPSYPLHGRKTASIPA